MSNTIEDSEIDDLKNQVSDLESRLDSLEEKNNES